MLDTSSRANFKPTAEIDDLDVLAKEVCRHLAASANAAQNFLEHALAAGDALIRAKKQVKPGNWYGWLRSCDLSEDKANATCNSPHTVPSWTPHACGVFRSAPPSN